MADISPERERTLRLQARVFDFACNVVMKCPYSIPHVASREVWRQVVRAAPSTSYNLEEADEASGDADFIAKMKIALREAKEARRCLRLMTRCKLAGHETLGDLEDEARQISAIFATIIIKVKARVARENADEIRTPRQRRSGSITRT